MHKPGWALAAVLAVAMAMASQTSALAQPPTVKPPPTTGSVVGRTAPPAGATSWADLMATQARLDAKAERIQSARDGNFTGIVVSAQRHELTVFWKGRPAAAAARAIDDARRGDSVQVLDARFSEAELLVEANKVVRTGGVTAVSPNVDGTGLSVSFAPGLRARPPVNSGVPITQTDTATPQLSTRGNDSPPYWGGANWSIPGSGCSTGFAIRIGGAAKMLSAGHCGANGNTARDGGGDVMGKISGDNNARDRLYINASSAGRVFNGGPGAGEFTNPVIGALHSFVGDFVCTSGAYSGTRCNIQVKAINQSINVGYTIFQTVRAEQIDHTNAVGQGDSGGPVEQVATDTTQVYAKGTNTAIDTSTAVACTGVTAGRTCAWRMYYVDVVNSLNAYGASIITG